MTPDVLMVFRRLKQEPSISHLTRYRPRLSSCTNRLGAVNRKSGAVCHG